MSSALQGVILVHCVVKLFFTIYILYYSGKRAWPGWTSYVSYWLFTASLFSARERKCDRSEREALGVAMWGGVCERSEQEEIEIFIRSPPLTQLRTMSTFLSAHTFCASRKAWFKRALGLALGSLRSYDGDAKENVDEKLNLYFTHESRATIKSFASFITVETIAKLNPESQR